MKKHLIAFTLLSSPLLVAGNNNADPQNAYASEEACNQCGSTCCTCEPCCVPKPKKCIDCVCYTPAYYDLQCDWGFFLDAEFLYWYARETNLSYAGVVDLQNVPNTPTVTTFVGNVSSEKQFGTDWEPGVRLGIGWNSDCDGWDTYLNWTYMQNTRTDSTSISATDFLMLDPDDFVAGQAVGQIIINPWSSSQITNIPNLFWEKASAKWSLTFNQIDFELGRKYWLSPCFTLRPFAALRGAWTKTQFKITTSIDQPDFTNPLVGQDDIEFINKSWGVGFSGGIQPNWHFCSNFILYSNVSAALLWGNFESKYSRFYQQSATSASVLPISMSQNSKKDFYMMQPVLDLALGLRWEETWCCDRYRTSLDLGWEHHVWFDYNHRLKQNDFASISSVGGQNQRVFAPDSYAEATGNLMMGGLVVRLRFDF